MRKGSELGGGLSRETRGRIFRGTPRASFGEFAARRLRHTPGTFQEGVFTAGSFKETEQEFRAERRRFIWFRTGGQNAVSRESAGNERGRQALAGGGDASFKPWQWPRRIAGSEGVGGVYGAPEVRVSIKNAEATGDIRAEVKIAQGPHYVLYDFGRILIELRPLRFRDGGSSAQPAQPQARAQARARPALLLGTAADATRFVGRDAELEILQQWLDSPDPSSVMLVHSSGGQGKTRLIRHFARLSGARQDAPRLWEAISLTSTPVDNTFPVHLPAAADEQGAAAPAPAAPAQAHLVIADEVDLWPRVKLVEMLRSAAKLPGGRVRVLATARTFGLWWASLRTEPAFPEMTWHEPLRLGHFDAATARQLVEAAGRSFARKLGWPEPPLLPQQDLDRLANSPAASYELLVLSRLYAANTGVSTPQSQRAAAQLLLEQELRYWARMYGSDSTEDPYHIRLAPQFMARAVYLATLAGTLGYDIAQPITQLADLGCHLTPQQVIEDHARCYPADDNQLLAPAPAGLAEEFLAMLAGDTDHPMGILPADPWAVGAAFRLLGVMTPQERQPEDDIRKRCIAAGEEPPPAEPRYSKVIFGPQLQPMIIRLTRAAASRPQLAEQQLYPLAYFYPQAVVMAGPAALDELLALQPPRYIRAALDKARSECDPDDPQPYRQAMEELAAMRGHCGPAAGGDS